MKKENTPASAGTHHRDEFFMAAFTFIELMLVVIIIAVLAAMSMPRLAGRSEQARISATKADINANIALALDLFEVDTGYYPERLEDLLVNPGLDDGWNGPYLKKIPKDAWGNPYRYKRLEGENPDYQLCSNGPDSLVSTDDICNY